MFLKIIQNFPLLCGPKKVRLKPNFLCKVNVHIKTMLTHFNEPVTHLALRVFMGSTDRKPSAVPYASLLYKHIITEKI